VEAAKVKTRELTAAFEKSGALPQEDPLITDGNLAVYTDGNNAEALRNAGADGTVASWLKAHFSRIESGDYAALLAYIDRNDKDIAAIQTARLAIRDNKHVATCAGFGPRFQHSTGQAYKGGPNTGVFIQITADDTKDLAVPGQKASFGIIKAAQARGDFGVLTERDRRALRLHIKGDVTKGLAAINTAVAKALS
jgi:transaldolase/glucose-6-phosphate isomerase